jgi:hypothetical protein
MLKVRSRNTAVAGVGRYHPLLLEMRLETVFLRVRPMVFMSALPTFRLPIVVLVLQENKHPRRARHAWISPNNGGSVRRSRWSPVSATQLERFPAVRVAFAYPKGLSGWVYDLNFERLPNETERMRAMRSALSAVVDAQNCDNDELW